MRVAYVCDDPGIPLDGTKGASVHVRQTIGALSAAGLAVSVWSCRPGRDGAVPSAVVAISPSTGPGPHEPASAAAVRGREAELPSGGTRPDIVYERYALWSLTGLALARRFSVPLVLEVNAPLPEEAVRYRGLETGESASARERLLLESADVVMCVSAELAERAMRLSGRGAGIHVAPNAVDTELFSPAPLGAEDSAAFHVGFVGSLKPWHGVAVLLDAFERLAAVRPEARLTVVGDGPERADLESRVARGSCASRVRFTGALPHDRIPEILRACHAAVAPYPPLEAFYFSPLKVGEYLACGVPVVASAAGEPARILEHGKNALLVPPGDAAALENALAVLAADAALRRRLGAAGRALAVQQLSLKSATARLVERLGATVRAGGAQGAVR